MITPPSRHRYVLLLLFFWGGLASSTFAQGTVTGTVTDTDGIGIPGVNIRPPGTSTGTVTDLDGSYSVTLPAGSDSLSFSFTGFNTQTLYARGVSSLPVILRDNIAALEEIVVIGYGTQRKVNLTGAVGTATSEQLQNRPITNVGTGLQGVVGGLNVAVANGDPSQGTSFNVRGFESINGGSPLVLVDNVPMDINRINPNDIESVSVLKDAAAAAIYGARAAFGVILITTKKGKDGKVSVTFSTEQASSAPIFNVDPVNDPNTFVTLWNEAATNGGGNPVYDDDYVAGTRRYSENPTVENEWGNFNGDLRYYGFNDYQNRVVADNAPQRKYDLSLSGAANGTSYYASVGYLTKDGYLNNEEKNQNFQRLNVLMKVDFRINDWLSLEEKVLYNNQQNDTPQNYSFDAGLNSLNRISPIEPLSFPDLPFYRQEGDRELYEQFIGLGFANTLNSLPYLEQGGRQKWERHDVWLTQGLTLTPLKGLSVKSTFAYQFDFRTQRNVANKIDLVDGYTPEGLSLGAIGFNNGFSGNDFISERQNFNQQYVWNTFANYAFEVGAGHNLDVTAGFNQEWFLGKQVSSRGETLLTPILEDIATTTGTQTLGGGSQGYALRGAFYSLKYNFKERYLLEANGRYDGTSRFPTEDRFGFFPSFSAGWRISQEPFMAGTRGWLDNLKIRASYGTLGNQNIERIGGGQDFYPYIPTLSPNTSNYTLGSGNIPFIRPPGLVSPTLTWESVTTQNIGFDVRLLEGRIDMSVDVYTRDTKDMLLRVNRPDILGAPSPAENGADLRTKGWEFSLMYQDKIRGKVDYSLRLNVWDNTSEITKYDNPTGTINNFYVGQQLGEIWGFESDGFFQSEEEILAAADHADVNNDPIVGDTRYADLNGDGVIDQGLRTLDSLGDLRIIGNSTARYSFGVTPTIKFKGLTLSAFFQGLFRDFLPDPGAAWASYYPYQSGYIDNTWVGDTWSEDNRDAFWAIPRIRDQRNIRPQSKYVENASYVRLKNLSLSYRIPTSLSGKIGMSNANVYVAGQNLWEYSQVRSPLDPETTFLRQEYYFERTVSVGLNATF